MQDHFLFPDFMFFRTHKPLQKYVLNDFIQHYKTHFLTIYYTVQLALLNVIMEHVIGWLM
jgi:hypothetical protein